MDWANRGNVLQLSNAMVNSAIHWIWRDVLWFIVLICKALAFVFLGMVRLRKGQTLQKVYNVHLPARVSGNCGLKSEKFSRQAQIWAHGILASHKDSVHPTVSDADHEGGCEREEVEFI